MKTMVELEVEAQHAKSVPSSAQCGAVPMLVVPEFPKVASPRNAEQLWSLIQNKALVARNSRHLGQALVDAHAISNEQLQQALHAQERDRSQGIHSLLGNRLVATGIVSSQKLEQVIANWLGSAVVDASTFQFDPKALALIRSDVAERELIVPLMLHDDMLVMLMADINDRRLLEELRFMTQHRILGVMAAPGTLMPAIARAYTQVAKSSERDGGLEGNHTSSRKLAVNLADDVGLSKEAELDAVSESDNILVRMINSLIEEAIELKASDIHIETQVAPRKVRVRLRVDGELVTHLEVEARFRFALVARIKIMANMDISEHRKPQDGKIDFARFGGSRTELRVVTVPTSNGLEDVVLRLLAGSKALPLSHIVTLPPKNVLHS